MKTDLAEKGLDSSALEDAFAKISEKKMQDTLSELCSDKYQGRRAGTTSHDLATSWIAKTMLDLGLRQTTQTFYTKSEFLDLYSAAKLVELDDEGRVKRQFEHRTEFAEHPRSKELEHFVEGQVVAFSEQADLTDRFVIFDHGLGSDLGEFSKQIGYRRALGVIIPQSVDKNGFFWKQLSAPPVLDLPAFFVRKDLIPSIIGKKMRVILPLTRSRIKGTNVIGEIEGHDKSLESDPIIVSAHYDAVGDDALSHRIHGAGDNAAGLAVVLELARILSSSKIFPKRTIQFIAFDAEEANASGSAAYSRFMQENKKNPTVLNLDGAAVYRGTASVEAAGNSPKDLVDALDYAGEELEIPLAMGNVASDNRRFASLGFASAGIALGIRALHTPADTIETVDPSAMRKATELLLVAIWKLAYDLT